MKVAVGELPHTFRITVLMCQNEPAYQMCCALNDWDPEFLSCRPDSDSDMLSMALGRSLQSAKCVEQYLPIAVLRYRDIWVLFLKEIT